MVFMNRKLITDKYPETREPISDTGNSFAVMLVYMGCICLPYTEGFSQITFH
jgi:hypothetical protein